MDWLQKRWVIALLLVWIGCLLVLSLWQGKPGLQTEKSDAGWTRFSLPACILPEPACATGTKSLTASCN